MNITRQFVMPNKWTFQMKPVRELLDRLVGNGAGWIDPFSGESERAEHSNDFNPNRPSTRHCEAIEFVQGLAKDDWWSGVLFDPPYTPEQMKRSYTEIGTPKVPHEVTKRQFADVKDCLSLLLPVGATVICFGWNTAGFGKGRGFELKEVHILNHGGRHNDTLITVECKKPTSQTTFPYQSA